MSQHIDLGLEGPTIMLGPLLTDDDFAEVETHRRLDCQKYDACLAVAQSCMWPGFTCRGCSKYKPGTPPVVASGGPSSMSLWSESK